MGCWGITAMQSDAGLAAVGFIREHLPQDGQLELSKVIQSLNQDEWNRPPEVTDGQSHTSPMALAEIMVKFLERDIGSLDYDEESNKFGGITSFTATRESIQWVRDYIEDTLKNSRKNAGLMEAQGMKWGGWFKEEDWTGWQEHMTELVERLDVLLTSADNPVELVQGKGQEYAPAIGTMTQT